ncbi:hypothetical protein Q73_13705 [Bacillus coahuilensis m2-6]|uniref:DoxX family protein n=1 Tax=Bacillus coahuilensis TaxID=408580 RepID=UPI0001851484|nr:DoxX family protein [Bacillus coahuilensis]KUP05130.1 hypothetical protein Q73_13705 [Bacillus coahuilensis m2-6]
MTYVIWVLQAILIYFFLSAGFLKLIGSKKSQGIFTYLNLPKWFMYVTGFVEVVGALLLFVGFWLADYALAGALVLSVTAIGGTLAHIRIKDSFKSMWMIVLLGLIAFALVFLQL